MYDHNYDYGGGNYNWITATLTSSLPKLHLPDIKVKSKRYYRAKREAKSSVTHYACWLLCIIFCTAYYVFIKRQIYYTQSVEFLSLIHICFSSFFIIFPFVFVLGIIIYVANVTM